MATASPPSQPGADRPGAEHLESPPGTIVTASHVREAVQAAAAWLELQAASVNALNVFPVPDGDTGTNMSMTLRAAAEAAAAEPREEACRVALAAAQGALMGARGNSGVILSQLLRGFAEAAAGKVQLSVGDLADGFVRAAEAGYRSVARPVEGTILTVARRAARAAQRAAPRTRTVSKLLERVLRAADQAVAETTDQLDVLRSAGVVDAGGQGYRLIVEAFWRTACGKPIEASGVAPVASQALVAAQHVGEAGLGFCTELLLRDPTETVESIRAFMESVGESVIVVGDGSLVRVHVHVLRPGVPLDYAAERGTLSKIKVENMQLQYEAGKEAAPAGEGISHIGVIAVAPGLGFESVFGSLGAATVVEGGQTMNPSVQDILAAVNRVGYRELILLPNNANILMAAQRAAEQTPRALRVVPTRSLPQGVAALLAFNYEADLEINVGLMQDAASRVASIEVTRAVRSAQVQGWQVERGQSLGLLDGDLVAVAEDVLGAVIGALARCQPETREIVTIYSGADVPLARAEELAESIRATYPHVEVELAEGGQPHYPYILSVE
ncbi:MAG TPA: DAK2 domain-containing protein [Chloroflexota bacterium]|nr:DAK2 domain-containing protein [Chloroflexota bacterium]